MFAIHVSGDFANLVANGLFRTGGGDLESKTWEHFNSQVAARCAQ
jgi:hypothetical protein